MSLSVAVVDYGRGNLFSISRALAHLGAEARVTADPAEIASAGRLILPGVGAFGDGMENLRERGLVEPLKAYAATGRPLLGICLGMQLLMDESEEFGRHAGLGLVPGRVRRFPDSPERRWRVPHVGWSALETGGAGWRGSALEGLKAGERMYFVHSYFVETAKPEHRLAVTPYAGLEFCSVLRAGSVEGCQFHPEKSGESGLCLLKTWLTKH
ncbi:MAG: imidazole glycerol phosphate synthase subunit HisH [Elusimicrobiota bacterium]|nr:imidazole glycerol phosphate synthase subunit HisH [Elusimicrobiota bacterium]